MCCLRPLCLDDDGSHAGSGGALALHSFSTPDDAHPLAHHVGGAVSSARVRLTRTRPPARNAHVQPKMRPRGSSKKPRMD